MNTATETALQEAEDKRNYLADREERQKEMRAEMIEANDGKELTIAAEIDALAPPIIFPLLNAALKRFFC